MYILEKHHPKIYGWLQIIFFTILVLSALFVLLGIDSKTTISFCLLSMAGLLIVIWLVAAYDLATRKWVGQDTPHSMYISLIVLFFVYLVSLTTLGIFGLYMQLLLFAVVLTITTVLVGIIVIPDLISGRWKDIQQKSDIPNNHTDKE